MRNTKREHPPVLCWYDENRDFHREEDLPAIEYGNGDREWYRHGRLHREGDLPAVELSLEGFKSWWLDGVMSRLGDKPTVEISDGTQEWWKDGEIYRFDKWIVL